MKKKVISLALGLIFVLQMVLSAGVVFASDAPTVVSVTPAGDNVEKAAIGKITFSTTMDKSTLTSENIIIEDEWGDTITPTSTTVWDDAYTFVAEFESDTEYIVTVTTNVKSADGVALADDYEHSFITGTINGIENVTPSSSANFSSNTSGNGGTNGSLANVYDGNLKNDFTTYGGTAPKWIKIDLGKAYEIAYISYIPKSTSYDDSWIGNHSIQVSKTGEGDWITLATTPVYDSSQSRVIEHVVAPIDTEKYQYVRLWKNTAYIACTEIDVYAYQGKPEVERVSLSGEGLTKAAAGKVVFSTAMDRSTLTSENIVITDEWGEVVTPTATSAYDKEFVFTADFKADTEYVISVSSNVKSASGVAASSSTHSFTTGDIIYSVENVTPALSGFSYKAAAHTNNLSAVCDNNLGSLWNTFGATNPASLTADLGKAQDIAYIVYCGNKPSDPEYYASDMKIQVSNDNATWTDLAITPTLSANKPGALQWIAINETGEKFQYVRLTKASNVIYVGEIDIYAYPGAPEVVSVTPQGEGITKIGVGKVTFSAAMDRSTLTSENIVITDEWGETVIPTVTSAYDKEFAFTADFKAGTEYKISVSSMVKSAAGVSVVASEHTFVTEDMVYGVENITPELSGFSYKAGAHTNNFSTVCDNNLGTLWNTFGSVNPASLTADLGKAQDIAYIVYCGNTASQPENYASNMKIQVSNDNATWTDLAITPTLSENKPGALQWIAVNETGEKFQYVRLTRASNVIYIGEVDIYAYESAPEVVSVTPSGEAVTKAQAGKVTFSSKMDRSTLTSENIVITESATGNVVTPKVTSAYDNAFTFVADFAPNTTYKVSVSSNVKSASGLAAIAYEHTFTTGAERYIAKNVTPDVSGFSFKAGATANNLQAVCDNNTGSLWNTYGATNPASLTADLGEAKDIAYISYHGKRSTDPDNYAQNMKIQVSNDNATWTDLAVTPTLTADKSGLIEWIAVNETGESFQYVRLTRALNVIYVSELAVYAYEYEAAPKVTGMSFGENGAENVEYAKMMRVDFDSVMNRYTLTSDNIIVTDAEGNTVAQTVSQAYDKAYVFACDFKSKTTYKVTVTTRAKTISGTPVAENITYTFTTGWVAPVKNVTPWGDEFYSSNSGTFLGEYDGAQAIYTGGPNDETFDKMVGGTAWIQTDLGKEMPLAYVSYLARNAGVTAEQYRATMRGSEVLVSNDPEFKTFKKLGMVPEFYSDEAAVKGIYWNFVTETNGESYRYIRIQDNDYVFISELKVFAYQPKIEELTQDDIDQVAKTDEYAVKGSAMYGTVDSGESVTYMVEIDKLAESAADAKVYIAVYGYNQNANRVLVGIYEAAKTDDVYTVTANIQSGLVEADVNFFVWGEDQIPLMEKIIKRNF